MFSGGRSSVIEQTAAKTTGRRCPIGRVVNGVHLMETEVTTVNIDTRHLRELHATQDSGA